MLVEVFAALADDIANVVPVRDGASGKLNGCIESLNFLEGPNVHLANNPDGLGNLEWLGVRRGFGVQSSDGEWSGMCRSGDEEPKGKKLWRA